MATGVIKSEKAFVIDVKGTQQTGTINGGATTWVGIPYNCPQGYKAISTQQIYITGSNVAIYQWSLSRNEDVVSIAFRNVGSASTTYTADATVVCIKTS